MQFNSFVYLLIFLPAVFVLYWLSHRHALANAVLIVASYIFYGWGEPWVVVLLISSSVVDYGIGKAMMRSKTMGMNRLMLVLSLLYNLGLLAAFKYWDWLVTLLGITWHGHPITHGIGVPPGLSFYTFQTLSYTIDIYRRRIKPQGTLLDYLAFVAFFPHLVAGPIMRARDLLPQLARVRAFVTPKAAEAAFFLIAWGLFKKIAIADNMGNLIKLAKLHMEDTPGAGLMLVLAFCFQIYCDFSAYTDIARGSAKLFSVRLRRNFFTPYFSMSPSDFWRRWHRSLSSWVRDYLYIPLGGNRCSLPRNLFNLLFTMGIIGLWHGAGIFFVLWGFYNGLLLAIYRLLPIDKFLMRTLGQKAGRVIATLLMFCLVLFGWLLFYSRTPEEFFQYGNSTLALFSQGFTPWFWRIAWGFFLFSLPIIITDALAYYHGYEFVDLHRRMSTRTKTLLYLFMFYAIVFFGVRASYDFIYFQF